MNDRISLRLRFLVPVFITLLLVSNFSFSFAQEAVTVTSTEEVTDENSQAAAVEVSQVPALPVASDERVLPNSYKVQTLEGDDVSGDFVVGPGKVELELAPGTSRTVLLTIANRTGVDKLFSVFVEDAEGSQDAGTPIVLLGDDTGPYTLKEYISIEDSSFILGHNKRVEIPVKVTLPENAEPGGRYGSVLVTTTTTGEGDGTTAPRSVLVSRIGTLFFVTTPGLENEDGRLVDFATSPKRTLYSSGPINFGLLFENIGSVHLNPYGEIRINNMFGTEIGMIEIDPWFSMPQSMRLREVLFEREWLFGRYTATASINRGFNNEIDVATYTFWVINWFLVLGVFVGLFAIILIFRLFFKRFEFRRKM